MAHLSGENIVLLLTARLDLEVFNTNQELWAQYQSKSIQNSWAP